MRPSVAKLSRAFDWLGAGDFRLAWVTALSVFTCFIVFRCLLWWSFATSVEPPIGFVVERMWLHELLGASVWDVLTAVVVALPVLGCSRWTNAGRSVAPVLGGVLCFACSFVCAVHLKLLFARGEHFGYQAAREALQGAMTWGEALSYATTKEVALLAVPFVAYLVWWGIAIGATAAAWRRLLQGATALACVIVVCWVLPGHRRFPFRIQHNPVMYGLSDIVRGAVRPAPRLEQASRPVSSKQRERVDFVDAQFVELAPRTDVPQRAPMPNDAGSPPNVVIVVLESTAAHSVFEPTPDGSVAMPFLKDLAAQSWWMDFHHSTSNSSHRSLFSLFTGLYPSFGASYFCLTPAVDVPTLGSFLPPNYERFLVTPGDLRSYFPRSLLMKTGLPRLIDRSVLAPRSRRPASSQAVDEFDALDAFLSLIREQKRPFLGVYYSYVPHFHYRDYGPSYQVMPNLEDPRHRYINNLRLIDGVLKTIVLELEGQGLWENTIFAVVGDHGEAFGEHGLFTHANDMHQESIHAPWLLRFPGVTPRVVKEPTSHVDFLPTLLDTLALPHDPTQFQGESLWSRERKRRYVFSVGNERSFVSIAQDRSKLLSIDMTDSCARYDLLRDPRERRAQPCDESSAEYKALADFRGFQSETIQRLSKARLRN